MTVHYYKGAESKKRKEKGNEERWMGVWLPSWVDYLFNRLNDWVWVDLGGGQLRFIWSIKQIILIRWKEGAPSFLVLFLVETNLTYADEYPSISDTWTEAHIAINRI